MNPWKVLSRNGNRLFLYLTEGERLLAFSYPGLADYITRFRGELLGVGPERIRFTKGRHAGKTLAEVGIGGVRTFNALADGWSLCHDEQLIPPGHGRHTPGFDFQLAPPKSASVAAMNREHRRVLLLAHQRAVRAAFRIMEGALVCKIPVETPKGERTCKNGKRCRTQGSDTRPGPGELIAFATTHWTARPTKETLERESGPDPHLHTHMFIFNMAWAGGKWRAVDHRGLMHRAKYAEAVYHAHLAHELAQAGIQIEPFEDAKGVRSFQLAGADPEVDWFCSSRHREIAAKRRAFEHGYGQPPTKDEWKELSEQFVERNGRYPSRQERAQLAFEFKEGHGRPPTDDEEAQLGRSGRMPKEEGDHEPDWESQIAALERAGLRVPEVVRGSHYDPYEAPLEQREAEVMADAMKSLHLKGSSFPRYEVPPAIWRASIGRLRPEETEALIERVGSSGEFVVVGHHQDRASEMVTTTTLLSKEDRLLSTLLATAKEPAPAPPAEHVAARLYTSLCSAPFNG